MAGLLLVSGLISEIIGAPYVPLPKKSLKGILDFAKIKDYQNLYDLGSGDGRVLIEAVKNFGIEKGIGYEISPWPFLKAKFLVRRLGLSDKIRIFRQNFLNADLNKAEIVFIYLFPKIVQKLALKFNEVKPEAKIICVSFPIDEPEKFNLRLIKTGKVDRFSIYIYQKM